MTKKTQQHRQANHRTHKVNKKALRMEKAEPEIVKNPAEEKAVKYLTDLKNRMLEKLDEAEKATSPYKKSIIIKEVKAEYLAKMEKLMSVYNPNRVGQIPAVEKIKVEVRALYEEKIQFMADELARQYEKQIEDEIASPAHQALLKEIEVEDNEEVAIIEQLIEDYNEAVSEALKQQHETEAQAQIQNERNQVTLDRIDGILIRLGDKIDGIGEHSEEALIQAVTLHETLTSARDAYAAELKFGENVPEATQVFKETCAIAINSVMPTLETDLGWGEYLKNMLKSIANVFIAGAQKFGSSITFFNTNSKSSQAVAETGQELQSEEEYTLSI